MRIHSKFKDYYDTALGYGIDEGIHYVRETTVFERTKDAPISLWGYKDSPRFWNQLTEEDIDLDFNHLLFCGKLYSFVVIRVNWNDRVLICWTYEEVEKYLFPYVLPERRKMYFTRKNLETWRNYFEVLEHRNFADIHHDTGIPVILFQVNPEWNRYYRDSEIIYNPCLKDIHFFKVMDPFTCFQELSMYIGGVLGGNSPKMVTISDEMKVYKHGFDPVYGFRKRKES